jgi:hypothetical protein
MKDLIITYTSENKVIKKEYDHIFDFTDEIEDTNISVPTQRNITATFLKTGLKNLIQWMTYTDIAWQF